MTNNNTMNNNTADKANEGFLYMLYQSIMDFVFTMLKTGGGVLMGFISALACDYISRRFFNTVIDCMALFYATSLYWVHIFTTKHVD